MPLRSPLTLRRSAIGVAAGAIVLPALLPLLACGASVPWDGGGYAEPSMRTEVLVRAPSFDRQHVPRERGMEWPLPTPASLVEERLARTDGGALIDDLSFDGGDGGPLRDGGARR